MRTLLPRVAPCPCGSGLRYKQCHGRIGVGTSAREELALLEGGLRARSDDTQLRRSMLALIVAGGIADEDIGAALEATATPASPRVAVVTPYYRESLATLRRCHESVLAQTWPCRHFVVADGMPDDALDEWDVQHMRLSGPNRDYGDTPRAHGGEAAIATGFTAIAYLDADNTYRPQHVASLMAGQLATGAPVCHAERTLHLPDDRLVPMLVADDAAGHIDTSCLLLTGEALALCAAWRKYPRPLSAVGDRVFVRMLKARGFEFARSGAMTVRYTVNEPAHYRALGFEVPATARDPLDLRPLGQWYGSLDAAARDLLESELEFPLRQLLHELLSPRIDPASSAAAATR